MSELFREPIPYNSDVFGVRTDLPKSSPKKDTDTIEIRCPSDLGKLFAKIQLRGEKPAYTPENWIEIACYDCKRDLRDEGTKVRAVLHYYNFLGELVKSEVVR